MEQLNYGEELICLREFNINDDTYPAGAVFPYEEMDIDFELVKLLYGQKKIVRKKDLSPEQMTDLRQIQKPKIIKNFSDGRVAVSWPDGEPLPEGVVHVDDLRKQSAQEEPDDETEEVELSHEGGGWYNVLVDGKAINTEKLRKKGAKQLMEEYVNAA